MTKNYTLIISSISPMGLVTFTKKILKKYLTKPFYI